MLTNKEDATVFGYKIFLLGDTTQQNS